MSGIPVTVTLDARTFNKLEQIAKTRGVNMRTLIVSHLRTSLEGEYIPSSQVGARIVADAAVIDMWVEAARSGVTNQVIAERWKVSKSLVSRRLRERGIKRHLKPRGSRAHDHQAS